MNRRTRLAGGCLAALVLVVAAAAPAAAMPEPEPVPVPLPEHGVAGDCGWAAVGPALGGWSVAVEGVARDVGSATAAATTVVCEVLAYNGITLAKMDRRMPGEVSALVASFFATIEPSEFTVCWYGVVEYADTRTFTDRRCSVSRSRTYGSTMRKPAHG